MSTIVDRLFEDFVALTDLINAGAEPSLNTTANDCFKKALLLSAASSFEARISGVLLEFAREMSQDNECLVELTRQKAIARQYHSLFDWDRNNANRFFAHFGERFKKAAVERVKIDEDLESAVRAFMEIGRERNRIVHQDFGAISLEKTAEEIYELYRVADRFVEELPALLRMPIPAEVEVEQ